MKGKMVYLFENVVFWIVAIFSAICDGARAAKESLAESVAIWDHINTAEVPEGLSTGRNTDQDGRFNVIPLLLVGFLCFSSDALAQVNCARFGNSLSCDGPNLSNRTITEFDKNRGIITDERGNVEPYTIIGNDRDRDRDSEARRRSLIYGEDRDRNESRSRYGREEDR